MMLVTFCFYGAAMKTAYSYVRFSTPEQAKGDSLRRQIDKARAFAAAHDLALDESLKDEGISAYRGSNKEKGSLGAFLAKVEAGEIQKGSYLIVESLDRLSREQVHVALRLFLTLIEHGIVLATLSDNKIYSDASIAQSPTELIVSIALMMRSHDESAIKSDRVSQAWEKKRRLAESDKVAMTKICPAWLAKVGQRYVAIPERATVVQKIFAWAIEGLGTRSIAKRLNQMGVQSWTTKKDKRSIWHDSYIKKILDNPAVFGEYTPRSKRAGGSDETASETIEDYFPAVVDRETFYKARAVVSSRATSNVRAPAGKHRNVLSGLVKCSTCGGGMHYIDKGKNGGRPFLRCGKSLLDGGCLHTEKYPYEVLQSHAILSTSGTKGLNDDEHATRNSSLREQLTDVEDRIEKIADAIERTGLSDILERRVQKLEQQRKTLKSDISRNQLLSQKISYAARYRHGRQEVGELARRLLQEPDDIQLRTRAANAVRALFKEIRVSPDGVEYIRVGGGGFSEKPMPANSTVLKAIAQCLGEETTTPTTGRKIQLGARFFTDEEIEAADDQD